MGQLRWMKTSFSRNPAREGTDSWAYNDTGLQTWKQDAYRICTWNSASHTCSSWTVVRELQAPPEGLAPPEIPYVFMKPPKLLISWMPPQKSNGATQRYELQRPKCSIQSASMLAPSTTPTVSCFPFQLTVIQSSPPPMAAAVPANPPPSPFPKRLHEESAVQFFRPSVPAR